MMKSQDMFLINALWMEATNESAATRPKLVGLPFLTRLNSAAVKIYTVGRFDDNENFNEDAHFSLEFYLNKSTFTEKSAQDDALAIQTGGKRFVTFSSYFCLAFVDTSTKKFRCANRKPSDMTRPVSSVIKNGAVSVTYSIPFPGTWAVILKPK